MNRRMQFLIGEMYHLYNRGNRKKKCEVGLGQGNSLNLKPLRDQVRLRPFLKIFLACLGIILYCKKKQRRFLQ